MADALASVGQTLSQLLWVPASWFESPIFLINLVLPFVGMVGVFYLMLSRKVRIFRNGAVNLTLSVIFAFFSVPFVIVPFTSAAIALSVFGVVTLLGDRITGRGLAVAFGLAIISWLASAYGAYLISLIFV